MKNKDITLFQKKSPKTTIVSTKIETLKRIILNNIREMSTFLLIETEIYNLINMCYILNEYLNNNFLDEILYDTKLKYQDNYDDLYIYENIDRIEKFIKAQ